MIVIKYTAGFVKQYFNTETDSLVGQSFTACDFDGFENEDGKILELTDDLMNLYHPFTMIKDLNENN